MASVACPVCGLSSSRGADEGVAVAVAWSAEFLRRCQHVRERRHAKDLRSHTCPHWAKAMRQAAPDPGGSR